MDEHEKNLISEISKYYKIKKCIVEEMRKIPRKEAIEKFLLEEDLNNPNFNSMKYKIDYKKETPNEIIPLITKTKNGKNWYYSNNPNEYVLSKVN